MYIIHCACVGPNLANAATVEAKLVQLYIHFIETNILPVGIMLFNENIEKTEETRSVCAVYMQILIYCRLFFLRAPPFFGHKSALI